MDTSNISLYNSTLFFNISKILDLVACTMNYISMCVFKYQHPSKRTSAQVFL